MSVKRKAFKRWFKRTGPWPVIPKGYNLEGILHAGFLAGWTACARAMKSKKGRK